MKRKPQSLYFKPRNSTPNWSISFFPCSNISSRIWPRNHEGQRYSKCLYPFFSLVLFSENLWTAYPQNLFKNGFLLVYVFESSRSIHLQQHDHFSNGFLLSCRYVISIADTIHTQLNITGIALVGRCTTRKTPVCGKAKIWIKSLWISNFHTRGMKFGFTSCI